MKRFTNSKRVKKTTNYWQVGPFNLFSPQTPVSTLVPLKRSHCPAAGPLNRNSFTTEVRWRDTFWQQLSLHSPLNKKLLLQNALAMSPLASFPCSKNAYQFLRCSGLRRFLHRHVQFAMTRSANFQAGFPWQLGVDNYDIVVQSL